MDLKLYILVAMLCICLRGYEVTGTKGFSALRSLFLKNANALIRLDSKGLQDLIRMTPTGFLKKAVAFHVGPSKFLKDLPYDQTVKFDAVRINEGGGYNRATGVFVCPVAGIYSITIDAYTAPGLWWFIKVNENIVGSVHAQVHGTRWSQISRTVIVKLNVGDHVYIQNHKSVNVHPGDYTGFSGVLLW